MIKKFKTQCKSENLIFSDKASVITPKKLKSQLNILKNINLIEFKTVFQSDNFSYKNESIKTIDSEKIETTNQISLVDSTSIDQPKNFDYNFEDCVVLHDEFVDNFPETKYKIVFPQNNEEFDISENIYFECGMITENVLLPEDFENIIWISSVDGLVGVQNKFNSKLTLGEHIIFLVLLDNGNKIIKDQTRIVVSRKSITPVEIDKQ